MIKLDPTQCQFVNDINNSLELLKERVADINQYVIVLNPNYYNISADKIFGIQVFYKNLDSQTNFILTEYKNIENIAYREMINNE